MGEVKSWLFLWERKSSWMLMQTITRENRVVQSNSGGLIVDYLGLVDQLNAALPT